MILFKLEQYTTKWQKVIHSVAMYVFSTLGFLLLALFYIGHDSLFEFVFSFWIELLVPLVVSFFFILFFMPKNKVRGRILFQKSNIKMRWDSYSKEIPVNKIKKIKLIESEEEDAFHMELSYSYWLKQLVIKPIENKKHLIPDAKHLLSLVCYWKTKGIEVEYIKN